MAFSTVVAFNRFQERGFIHIVAFHRLALVRRGNNLGGISQYDRNFFLLKGGAIFEERSQKSNHRKVWTQNKIDNHNWALFS